MQISRRVTNGLAWTGLILVVGIPSADIISAQFAGDPGLQRAAVVSGPVVIDHGEKPRLDAVPEAETAEAGPVVLQTEPKASEPAAETQVVAEADPVADYLNSGRKLPSYITGGGDAAETPVANTAIPATAAPATKPAEPEVAVQSPAPAPGTTATEQPVEVAAVAPSQKVAPIPMPLSMRPEPVEALVIPPEIEAEPSYPVAATRNFPVVPPEDVGVVGPDELEEWESGPLSDFLDRRNGPPQAEVDPDFDSDGFFLDEGPNSRAIYRRQYVEEAPVIRVYPLYD